jgi:hypothetical protein
VPGSLIEDVKRLLDAAPAQRPWLMTERSSPGWRVETAEGSLICYGPEELYQADNARLISMGPTYLEVLVSELEERDALIVALTTERDDQYEELQVLRDIKARLEEVAASPLEGSIAAEVAWILSDAPS